MATQNLGSILVRSVQFGEKGPVLRRGDDGAQTIATQNGTLVDAGHIIEDEGVPLANQDTLNFVGAGVTVTDAGGKTIVTIPLGVSDHGGLTGLGDDDHSQYALLLGRAGGQALIGGTGASDNLTIRASSNAAPGQVIIDTTEDAVASELLRLRSQRATRAVNDAVFMAFYQPDSAGVQHEFGRITNTITTVTDGSEGGALRFNVSCPASGGGSVLMVDMDGTAEAVIINPSQTGVTDFVVRSTNVANLMRADSGTENFGFGGTPSSASFMTLEPGVVSRTRVTGIAIGMNFPAETYTQGGASTVAIGAMIGYDTPTFAAAGASTITNAATLYIQGAPAAGANMTLTNSYALLVDGGSVRMDGALFLDFEGNTLSFTTDDSYILSQTSRMIYLSSSAGSVTINPDGLSFVDFIVEGDTETSLIVATAGQDVVGIGGPSTTGVQLTIEHDTDGVSLELLRLRSVRATRADGDEIFMSWYQPDSVGTQVETTRLTSVMTDTATGVVEGMLQIECMDDGALVEMARIGVLTVGADPQFRINAFGLAHDFRVEGANNSNIIFIDGGTDNLGLGATPSSVTFISVEAGTVNRSRSTGIGIAINFAADTFTQTNTPTQAIGTAYGFDIPTFAATGAAIITEAASMYIQGAPVAGSNMTFSNPAFALWVDAGTTRLDGALIVNESSLDVDIRFESNNNANLFFMDGGNDNVGIGGVPNINPLLHLTDVTDSPIQEVQRIESTRATRADNDEISIAFFQPADNGTASEVGSITSRFTDVTAASRDSKLIFANMVGGVVTDNLEFGYTLAGVFEFGFADTVQARSTYTRNATVVEDRTLLQSSAATTLNNNNVLAAIIADLQAHGMFLGT